MPPFAFRAILVFSAEPPEAIPARRRFFDGEVPPNPGAWHETGAIRRRYVHAPPVPSGPRAIPFYPEPVEGFRRSLGTRPPGGRGASVRPPLEHLRCAPFAEIPDKVVWIARTRVKGWGGGKGKGSRKRVVGQARQGRGPTRFASPTPLGSAAARPIGLGKRLLSILIDQAAPAAPTLPRRENAPYPPRSVGTLPYSKELIAPSVHEGPDGEVRHHFLEGKEESHPIQVELPSPAFPIASPGCSRDAAPDIQGRMGTFGDASRNISIGSGGALEPYKRSYCPFGVV